MEIKALVSAVRKHGDAYVYYTKHTGKGTTYLVGTTDFDNKYVLAMAQKHGAGLSAPVTGGDVLGRLQNMQAGAVASGKIMVFSWTNNKFRFLEAKRVTKVIGMAQELRRAGSYR